MHGPSSFNPYEKLFYRPIEAAIRWCDLMDYEAKILGLVWDSPERVITAFPQWPCLYKKLEIILDAIRNQELRYGALGTTVTPGTPVDFKLLTIRHSDLKSWITHQYPDQRPSFLFHPTATDEAVRYDTYLILQADREALQVRLKVTEARLQELMDELTAAGLERESLSALAEDKKDVSEHSKASFLNIIGALLETMLGSSEAGRRHSIFNSQASIVDSITAHYGDVPGLGKRSLDEKFAAARRSLAQARR
ncbi:hypothetical protein J3P76_10315 [Pseudomonas sp. D1-36]